MRPVRAKALIINAFALAGRFAFINPYRGCVKTLLFLKNHKALTFTSQGFAMSKSCCNFRP
ncbi:hypothetical protein [uncultured Prevotella sp.]|uniref:hypothetical protein n=1 Tax=uncultured Prevotella sp. TaxID=159272 RepID=UPI0027E29D71|nr:hypothetical protein [uncultured Prevotella sp.]